MVNEERLREILGKTGLVGFIELPLHWSSITMSSCCADTLVEWANWLRQEVLPEANQAEEGGMPDASEA